MIRGRDVLYKIDGAIKDARTRLAGVNNSAQEVDHELLRVRRQEVSLFEKISKQRLVSLGDGEAGVDELGKIDKKASDLIAEHDAHISTLEDKMNAAAIHLEDCEDARVVGADALQEATLNHEEASKETREKLETDANYQALAKALEKANAIVDHAASKREVAVNDRTEKGKPYEADPLFQYLWLRQYGANAYKANPITRMLDNWVARLVDYRDARLNYERLVELPQRLSEHVLYVEEKANILSDQVEDYERRALEREGVTAFRDLVAQKRIELDGLDKNIERAEERLHHCQEVLSLARNGEEGPLFEALKLLTDVISDKSIPDLKILAAETLTPVDDEHVEALAALRLERFALEEDQKSFKKRVRTGGRYLSDLQDLRRRFKQVRYDSHQSHFKNDNLIGLLLTDFQHGSIDIHEVWHKLDRSHQLRRKDWEDDFGGDDWRGGFGLPGDVSTRSGKRSRDTGLGRDISRQIERELGRELGHLEDLFGPGGLGDLGGLDGFGGASHGRYQPKRRKSRHRRRHPRRRSRQMGGSRRGRSPRIRFPRGGGRGGGFKTGGGF